MQVTKVEELLLHPFTEADTGLLITAEDHDTLAEDAELQPQRRVIQHEQIDVAEGGRKPILQRRHLTKRQWRIRPNCKVGVTGGLGSSRGVGTEQVDEPHALVVSHHAANALREVREFGSRRVRLHQHEYAATAGRAEGSPVAGRSL